MAHVWSEGAAAHAGRLSSEAKEIFMAALVAEGERKTHWRGRSREYRVSARCIGSQVTEIISMSLEAKKNIFLRLILVPSGD